MLTAGELKEKIMVQRPIRTNNSSGGWSTMYGLVLDTFAAVVENRSNPEVVGSQESISNYVHFKMRYRPDVFIRIADRLVWRKFNFIVNNIKVDPRRTQIDIFVNSEMETSNRDGSDVVIPDPYENLTVYEDNGHIIMSYNGQELQRFIKVTT